MIIIAIIIGSARPGRHAEAVPKCYAQAHCSFHLSNLALRIAVG